MDLLKAENRELKQDLERKNEKELNMFEYLSGVVRKRDVEISDLRQESTEAQAVPAMISTRWIGLIYASVRCEITSLTTVTICVLVWTKCASRKMNKERKSGGWRARPTRSMCIP